MATSSVPRGTSGPPVAAGTSKRNSPSPSCATCVISDTRSASASMRNRRASISASFRPAASTCACAWRDSTSISSRCRSRRSFQPTSVRFVQGFSRCVANNERDVGDNEQTEEGRKSHNHRLRDGEGANSTVPVASSYDVNRLFHRINAHASP